MKLEISAEIGNVFFVKMNVIVFGKNVKTINIPSNKQKKNRKKSTKEKVKLKIYDVVSIIYGHSKKHKIETINIQGDFGLSDPALTALSLSIIYSILGGFVSLLSKKMPINKAKIELIPRYNQVIFKLKLLCILKLNFVNIIAIAFNLLKLYIKSRKEMRHVKSSNKRTYGNCYAEH